MIACVEQLRVVDGVPGRPARFAHRVVDRVPGSLAYVAACGVVLVASELYAPRSTLRPTLPECPRCQRRAEA